MRRVLTILCVAAVLLTGCGSSTAPTATTAATSAPTQSPAAVDRTVVRFAVLDWETPVYERLISEFETANPDIDIQVVSTNEVLGFGAIGSIEYPADAAQRLVAAADVINVGVSRESVEQGLLRDLTPLLEADSEFRPEELVPGALESYQWDGGTWAMPTTVNFRLIYFNKEAFDAAGVSYPEPGWTWDDLQAKAEALTVREGDETTMWGFVCPPSVAYWLIESRAGAMVDYSDVPPSPQFDSPAVIEAVRWYADLHLESDAMPYLAPAADAAASALGAEETIIDQQQAAMWPDFDALWTYRKMQGEIGVVPFPEDTPGAAANAGYAGGLVMSAGTFEPEAAWRWMSFLSHQELGNLGEATAALPARRSLVSAEGFWDGVDEDLAVALEYAIEHAYIVREPVGQGAFEQAIRQALSGEQTAQEAMMDAQAQAMAEAEGALVESGSATPVPTFAVEPVKEATAPAEGVTTITFMPGLGSLNMAPYRQLADEFHAANPDIVVELKTMDLMSGTVPDLATMAESVDCFLWYPSFQDADQRAGLLVMDSFVDADRTFPLDDIYPQTLEQFTYDGQLWGLPADITPFIIEYNKDLFDAAGLDYPSNDWTWDDFLAAALALTSGEGDTKQYGFVAEVYEANDVLLVLERLGARLIDDSVDPPVLAFNAPETIEAVEWYASLTTEHGVKPAFLTDITKLAGASTAYMEREALINEGRAAMWTNTGTTAALFGPRSGINTGAVSLPSRADGTSAGSLLTTSGYFISANTANREACWKWISFLSGQSEVAQGLPARQSVTESDAYRSLVGDERADAYVATVADAAEASSFQVFEQEIWLGNATLWLTQGYGQVLSGDATAAEAMESAQVMADEYRACVVTGDDFGLAASEACMKATDPSLPAFLYTTGE
ncbi:MAG: extracellular solute-binding protein [Anaerolineae bacterium]